MTAAKPNFAKWRYRLRAIVFGRPGYDRHYPFIALQRLRPDARAMRRATRKATAFAFLTAFIVLPITNFVVAADFAYASFTNDWLFPFAMIEWAYHLMTEPLAATPQLNALRLAANTTALHNALTYLAVDFTAILAVWCAIYWTNRNDRSLLSTEKGAANWILPEDMPATGLLPSNYDIYAGFAEPEFERIQYDANLQHEHMARIEEYNAAVAAAAKAMGADDPELGMITLPIYGDNDASHASGASQTDKAAPWLETTSTLPEPDVDINVPDFK